MSKHFLSVHSLYWLSSVNVSGFLHLRSCYLTLLPYLLLVSPTQKYPDVLLILSLNPEHFHLLASASKSPMSQIHVRSSPLQSQVSWPELSFSSLPMFQSLLTQLHLISYCSVLSARTGVPGPSSPSMGCKFLRGKEDVNSHFCVTCCNLMVLSY